MSNNPLSNLSYTNKDFNAIYTELLDLVKKLTYKWDPSISNESDPGNILLKLDAIIGDKNNYNTDKNVLENFPETLTQDISARSLYKQLAYRMPWYQAAVTDITFKWVGVDNSELTDISEPVTIPKFQLICDENNEFVYTTLSEITFSKNSLVQTVQAKEGIINTLNINGQEVIELNNLDYHNRIYFNENNVAENGIFIYNDGDNENDYWTMVDNLQVESLGCKYFEFGVDSRRNLCYIEFPDDIHNLIGKGLVIKYIVTNGANGNIISRTLDRFYEEKSVIVNGQDTVLNSDVIQLTNPSASIDGADPEDIETAYKHYRKTAGTFHTLVTLRDYMNAIYNSGLVSNSVVCDRLNDVQSTYTIVTDNEFNNSIVKQVATTNGDNYIGYSKLSVSNSVKPDFDMNCMYKYDKDSKSMIQLKIDNEDDILYYDKNWKDCFMIVDNVKEDLDAFDLKLYLLHSPGIVINFEDYKSTFNLEPSSGIVQANVEGYIEDQKCVQHDFKEILPNIPCLFKNSFPLDIKIIPHYKLGEEQIKELKVNINKALFKLLNSSNIEFGLEADYDTIYDTIYNADERIKVLILDDFTYTTFATYWDGKEFKDIPISEFNSDYIIEVTSKEEIISYKSLLSDYIYKNTYFIRKINSDNLKPEDILDILLYENTIDEKFIIDHQEKINELKDTLDDATIETIQETFNDLLGEEAVQIYVDTYLNKHYVYKIIDNQPKIYSDKIDQFRKDIITKSILAGRTPLFNQDNRFRYTIDQNVIKLVDTDRISTYLKLCPHGMDENYEPIIITPENANDKRVVEYKLKDNENIRFTAPSFTTDESYSNYVKFELILSETNAAVTNEQQVKLYYSEYASGNDDNNYDSKPIILQQISRDSNTTITLDTKVITYQEFKDIHIDGNQNNPSISGLMRPEIDYTDREVIIKQDGEIICDDEKFSDFLTENLTFIEKWEEDYETGTNSIQVTSKLFIEDLTDQNWVDWQNDNLEIIYTAIIYSIPSNCDYELQDNEYITFFYKTEDDDAAPYNYKKYGKGTILKPSFSVEGTLKKNAQINVDTLASTGTIPYSALNISMYQRIYSMYNYNDLSGSKTIDIRKMNEVEVKTDEKNKFYFITNHLEYDEETKKYYYTLNIDNGKYILNNDEYFIRIHSNQTEFEIVGAGTLLMFYDYEKDENNQITGTGKKGDLYKGNLQLRVKQIVDYEAVTTEGLNSFIDEAIQLPQNCYSIVLREQQIYNLSTGDKIILTLRNEKYYALMDKIDPLLEVPTVVFETNKNITIDDFDISYESNGTVANLPKITVVRDEAKWNATAVLNIQTSYDQEQKIHQNTEQSYKKISLNNDVIESPDYENVFDTYYTPETCDLYLLSSIMLDKIGGDGIDITYIDSYGNRSNPYLFLYSLESTYDKEWFTKNTDGSVTINLVQLNEDELVFNQCHIIDEYSLLLPIRNLCDNITFNLELMSKESLQWEIVQPINSNKEDLGKGLGKGIFYFILDDEKYDIEQISLKLSDDKTTNLSDKIILEPLFKFTYNDLFSTRYKIDYDTLYERIKYYDINNIFDYTHNVESDLYIEDPLVSKSFFNNAHIFNPFTLCMADLYMSDKTQSNITLVNNR